MRVLLCVLILVLVRGAHRNGGYSLSCTQMHFCESLTAEKAWFQLVSEISLVYGFDIGPLWCRQRSNFRNCQRQKCVVSVQKCWHLILLWFYEKKISPLCLFVFLEQTLNNYKPKMDQKERCWLLLLRFWKKSPQFVFVYCFPNWKSSSRLDGTSLDHCVNLFFSRGPLCCPPFRSR